MEFIDFILLNDTDNSAFHFHYCKIKLTTPVLLYTFDYTKR